jgi:hypothetical protein
VVTGSRFGESSLAHNLGMGQKVEDRPKILKGPRVATKEREVCQYNWERI